MSYTSKITVKETEKELLSAYHKQKNSRIKLKIKSLILFLKDNFKKQEDLAVHLCIGYSTLRLWLRKYANDGFESFIKKPIRGKAQMFSYTRYTPDFGCQTQGFA